MSKSDKRISSQSVTPSKASKSDEPSTVITRSAGRTAHALVLNSLFPSSRYHTPKGRRSVESASTDALDVGAMSERIGGDGTGSPSHRDAARAARPRVQQLRPTNKDLVQQASSSRTTPADASINGTSAAATHSTTANGLGGQQRPAAPRVVPRIVTGQGSGSTIIVNGRQKGNPILKHISNIGWEYGDIVPDYQVGVASCVLYLSLRYHQIHPEYIHDRIKKLGNMYSLRIMLLQCDTEQPDKQIKELTKVCLVNQLTLIVAWSAEECGGYLERYKMFEHKPPDLIRERVNNDYMSHLNSALTSIRGINKTDVVTLATNLGSFANIAGATPDDLSRFPGFGEVKVRRLQEVFRQPFRSGETRSGRERRAERERLYGRDREANEDRLRASATPQVAAVDPLAQTNVRRPHLPPLDASDYERGVPQSLASPRLQSESSSTEQANRAHDALGDEEEDIQDADEFGDILDGLTEEEQLQLAMEMSISGGGGGEDGETHA